MSRDDTLMFQIATAVEVQLSAGEVTTMRAARLNGLLLLLFARAEVGNGVLKCCACKQPLHSCRNFDAVECLCGSATRGCFRISAPTVRWIRHALVLRVGDRDGRFQWASESTRTGR